MTIRGRASAPAARAAGFALAAAALPLACALLSLHRGHHGDVDVFYDWYLATRGDLPAMYLTPRHDVNYPVLGVLQAVAPGRVLERLHGGAAPGRAAFFAAHKLALVPWCVALIAGFYAVARVLGLARPRRLALAFFALPCAWVGAEYFGQIDGMTAALQLGAAACGAWCLTREAPRPAAATLGVLLAGVALWCAALLSKQLALFAAPGLLALFALALGREHRRGRTGLARAGALLAVSLAAALLALPDRWVRLPDGAPRSHVLYVFTRAGPPHGEMIGNGPGLWSFLGWAPDASARDALAGLIAPRELGRALALAYALALVALCARPLARALRADDARRAAALCVLCAGLVHLAATLVLAGTHERYAFHAFAPLLLGLGALAPRSLRARRALRRAWIAGALYGLFVLSTVEWRAFELVFPLRSTQLVAVVLFALLYDATRAAARG